MVIKSTDLLLPTVKGLQRGVGEFKITEILNLRKKPDEGVHQWS
jgi:hypothetical protein